MQFLFSPVLGMLSDRFGRRPVLLASLAGAAVDYLLMSVGRQTAFGSQAPHAEEINAYIEGHPTRFRLLDSFSIPSGETVRLYECVR